MPEFGIDEFIIPAVQCIVGCTKAKQTRAMLMARIEAVRVGMESVCFNSFQLLYEA